MRRVLLLALLASAAPADAQLLVPSIVSGLVQHGLHVRKEHACRAGVPLSDKALAAASLDIEALMRGYLADAARGDGKALLALFSRRVDAIWRDPDGGGSIRAIEDPAAPLLTAVPPRATWHREGLVIAGDGQSATGLWRVDAPDGAAPLRYRVDLVREHGRWLLWHVYLRRGTAAPLPEPYCHIPGDVRSYCNCEPTAIRTLMVWLYRLPRIGKAPKSRAFPWRGGPAAPAPIRRFVWPARRSR